MHLRCIKRQIIWNKTMTIKVSTRSAYREQLVRDQRTQLLGLVYQIPPSPRRRSQPNLQVPCGGQGWVSHRARYHARDNTVPSTNFQFDNRLDRCEWIHTLSIVYWKWKRRYMKINSKHYFCCLNWMIVVIKIRLIDIHNFLKGILKFVLNYLEPKIN